MPTAKQDTLGLIRSDLFRYSARSDLRSGMRFFIRSAPFRFQCALRLRRGRNALSRFAGRLMMHTIARAHGVEIPHTVAFGPGLLIPHAVSIIVNSTASFGANCTLNHGVTVGSVHKASAVVGDNVYIGPHACLVENITIGDGATIGAGAIVVKDVAPGTTVAGNPAQVISTKRPGRLIRNAWPG